MQKDNNTRRYLAGSSQGKMPFHKYTYYSPLEKKTRLWPSNKISQAPRWCSVDLRDGNQALIQPMTVSEKIEFFQLLLEIGFLEIEIGFPSASQLDFDFARYLIEGGHVPEDVTIQVLCQAREHLIKRTLESLKGSKRAIFHLYNSTSPLQRKVVFNKSKKEVVELALQGVKLLKENLSICPETEIILQYSPESFSGTEPEFAVEICSEVAKVWGASKEHPMIINLPATVEMTMPNVYADQIEFFLENFENPESIILSLHTHNDRGTGVAATELGILAGAQRVEGTLFGNGERTGNCDLLTVALNLFSQGVDPELDFRDIKHIRSVVEKINKIDTHVRHPYAGDLVFTAFSGSHQDAIRKGIAQLNDFSDDRWEVPYLPIDPSDLGCSYRETVRVNSQSGKGGVGFILEEFYGVSLPNELLFEFSKIVQNASEKEAELAPGRIWDLFQETYLVQEGYCLNKYNLSRKGTLEFCEVELGFC